MFLLARWASQRCLDDVVLGKHFGKGITKIVERFIDGLKEGDEPKTQFSENDLTFPDADCLSAAAQARNFYNKINRTGGRAYREEAVSILNSLIDTALNKVFQQGITISLKEIFLKIRETLLKDEKELILLVEDFAALAGIQGALLDIIIYHGDTGGQVKLCPMRTALAVTTGYLSNRDTVLSRAVDESEWLIEDIPGTRKGTVKLIVNFIGRYLNAARLGEKELNKLYEDPSRKGLTDWFYNFAEHNNLDSDLADTLNDFDKSTQGYHLFPFNRNAIEKLAEKNLLTTDNNELEFNPRTVINFVRDILLNYRNDFEHKKFPPPNFLDVTQLASVKAQQIISKKISDNNQQKQIVSLLYFWGRNPDDSDINCIPDGVYTTFNLPSLFKDLPTSEEREKDEDDVEEKIKKEPKQKTDPIQVEINKWSNILKKWFTEKDITHHNANQLRKWINDEIKSHIDWNAELLSPMKLDQTLIFLPNTRSQRPSKVMVTVAEEDALDDFDKSTELRSNFMALISFKLHNSWNYDGAETDMARYANFIEKLTEEAIHYCHNYYKNLKSETLPVLARAVSYRFAYTEFRKITK